MLHPRSMKIGKLYITEKSTRYVCVNNVLEKDLPDRPYPVVYYNFLEQPNIDHSVSLTYALVYWNEIDDGK